MNATMPNFCLIPVDTLNPLMFFVVTFNFIHTSPLLPVASLIPGLTAFLGHVYNPDKAYQIGHTHSKLQFTYKYDLLSNYLMTCLVGSKW
jgi:hypothetical protein